MQGEKVWIKITFNFTHYANNAPNLFAFIQLFNHDFDLSFFN